MLHKVCVHEYVFTKQLHEIDSHGKTLCQFGPLFPQTYDYFTLNISYTFAGSVRVNLIDFV